MYQEEKKYSNNKQHIKAIIITEIKEHKSNLTKVKGYIEETFNKPLSSIDDDYIERKYMKYCSELWLQEITNFLKRSTEIRSVFLELFSSLNNIESLSNIPSFFKQLEYYKLLIEHYTFLRKENEKNLISRFKREFLEQIVSCSDSAEAELVFLETFIDFLSFSKSLQSITAELKVKDFCCGELSLTEFLKGIIKLDVSTHDVSLTTLQDAAKCLQQEDLFLIDKFKEVIGAYIKPVEIQKRKIDDRLVIEVTGKNVVISEILSRLENKLKENSDIKEVRFVGGDIIHIDTNLKNKVWRGMNIAILTKAIKIHNEVAWDVSGKDNNYTYDSSAGTGKDGHGEQGKDGHPGESGGNVVILVNKIENPENLTIFSNGGKGSKGQDGGNGKDGEEGKSITKAEFNEKFPSAAHGHPVIRKKNIFKTLNSINEDLLSEETVWRAIIENATLKRICDSTSNVDYFSNMFIETITSQGERITFSHYRSGIPQAFFLYKGSLGQPGGHGGEYGLGGQGGFAGEIIVKNLENSGQEFVIVKNTKQGEEGEKGQGGRYGCHGKNGLDMGYLDYLFWREPMFFYNGKYKIEYYDSSSSDRIWCPYKKKYAGITAVYNEHKKEIKYEERKNTRQNSDRQHHAQAVRKKNIQQGNILASYSHHLRSIEKSTFKDLRSDLENTKQRALQEITENQEQQEKHTMELEIKRHVGFVYQDKNKLRNDITLSASYNDITYVDGLIHKLKSEPQLLDNWLQLKGIELTHSEIEELFSNFKAVNKTSLEEQDQQSVMENKLKNIEQLLTDKYRLSTLQEIAKQLPPYQEVTDNTTSESVLRCLVEDKEKGNNISHRLLGTLNQYLYENSKEQREKISKFFKEVLQCCDVIFRRSLKTFILEVGKSGETQSGNKKYNDEYKEFLEKRELSLNIFFEVFINELSRPRHAKEFYLWIESTKDKSLISELEENIKKDIFLNLLYNRFNNQLKLEYDWGKCCKDQNILKEYNDYIREKGPLSESYRELLAYIYGINIRLYAEDEDNGLYLLDNLNSSSKKTIHVLYRANTLIELSINENYLRLEEGCKKNDDLYANILKEIEPLKLKQEFDHYLKNKAFLTANSLSEDKQHSEEDDIEKIIEYFTGEERQQLKPRLEKITFQYIGSQGILHYVLKRFSSDGKHVSYQELCYLINSILSSSIEDRKQQHSFCWIVAAHSQRNWIDELVLLQLENHFKRQLEAKSKWREYLSKIENKDVLMLFGVKLDQGGSISTQCIEHILQLLSNISRGTVSLEGLELSEWPYVLKEKYWLCKLLPLTNWQESDKLPTASYYLLSIENIFGTDLVEKLLGALEENKQMLSPDVLTSYLSNFHNEKWNLCEEELKTIRNCNISEWAQTMQQKFAANDKNRDLTQLVKLIEGNANTSKKITDNLIMIADSIKSICNENYAIDGRSVGSFTENDFRNWVKIFRISSINEGKQDIEKKMLAVIDRAIELKRGFKLRDTQRLAVLALLTNSHSTLAQVSTGEGKSLIVVAAALMKALRGEKVDIITSSSVLAKRDAEGNRDIYNLFGINVSHNCSEDIEKRKDAYSSNQIVYGDLSNFQRDYLLDRFYEKNILGDHTFANIIVDEVDSMLLDKGNNMLYLSHDLPGFDKLESVYIYIWQWINRPAIDYEDIAYTFDIKAIKETVISDLYGLVKKEDIGKLGSELSEQHKSIVWEGLIKAEILNDQGILLKENIDENKLNEILSTELSSYKDRLNYLLKECIGRDKYMHVPNHLRSFVENNLESWINSAITAFFMKAGQDYVVDVDRTGTSPDRSPNITILDRDTGTDQANSQWDDALHQFLQLKHGCKLSLQSLKSVFISNVSFFKLYRNLYGLTGTLGSQRERDLLREVHKVDFVTIPTAKSKQFHEDKSILCSGIQEWINHICNVVKILTEEKKRSVLIVCETVNDVEILNKAFGAKGAKHVHTYIRDYEEFHLAQDNKRLEQGQIIIATNLAGRGTDIKITEGLRKAGGLHVCLTYLPNNIRVEQQAFGRAARCGDKGSGQLIIMDSKGQEYSNSRILDLKKERDKEELSRISDIKAYYETQITMEESCLKTFQMQYDELKKKLEDKNVPTEVKTILLQSCLDKWAFWLDENSKCIKNVTDEQSKINFYRRLDKFISELNDLETSYGGPPHDSSSWLAWVAGNPAQMVKLGKYLAQKEELKYAIELFDEVIIKEPYFSEAAHYYKAFALAKQIDWSQKRVGEGNKQTLKEFKEELRKTARCLHEHSNFSMIAAGIIGKIKKKNISIIQDEAYEKQKESESKLYYKFSRSVDDIFGHTITPQSFVNYDVNEELAERLYKDLLENGLLKKPRVKKNISEERLNTISPGYGVLAKTLKSFLSGYQDIDLKEFQKSLKKAIPLPSREAFWKLLIQEEVLSEEVKYVRVDNDRLKEIDPSLVDFLTEKELKKQTLELNNEQMLLNVEWITQQNNVSNVFKKSDFIKIVGKDKYYILKEKQVLSFNKKAVINPSKIESMVLPYYDSIAIEDFTNKANIAKCEAEKILAELVEQQVLEKRNGLGSYVLKIKFDDILQVQLLSCSVYENVVRGLLSVCFIYRIVLQRIVKQLEEKNFPILLQLRTKPHQSLVFELFDQRIIRPAVVTTEDKDFEKTLKRMYKEMSEDKIKNIVSTLERSRSPLEALKVPDIKLKSLTEVYGQSELANLEEVHVFFLNGLDLLIQLDEMKWTRQMLLNTTVVTAMGILQIAVGTIIELYSMGIMTHVGAALVNEGVNDLFFAVSAFKSGYFSWKDYGSYKLRSVISSTFTAGVGAYFSRGAMVSRFGYKLAGPNFEVGEKMVANMCGTQLIKTAGLKVVTKQVLKSITLKATEGIVLGLADAGVDTIVENYLQVLCEDIVSNILLSFKQEVERHNISKSLEKAYETLGEESASKMITNFTKSVITETNCVEKFLPMAKDIVGSVSQGFANAVEKSSKTSSKLGLSTSTISRVVFWSDKATHIYKIANMNSIFLDNLDKKIRNKLDSEERNDSEMNSQNQKREGYEEFKKEITDQWKSLLCENAGRVISQHIVRPILYQVANRMVKYAGQKLQEAYQSYKESEYLERFKELKKEYKEKLQSGQQCENTSEMIDHNTEKYHKDLIKLMIKTRNPDLLADIVRESIPMDMTCVSACTKVIHMILKERGFDVPGLKIIVNGNNGIRQEFLSGSEGAEGIIINLTLQDNHFQPCGSGVLEKNRDGEAKNNCLYEALAEALPQIRDITPERFRADMALCIEHDKEIRYHIQQGWHGLPISLGAYGGANPRTRSVVVKDAESSSSEQEVHEHFQDRIKRYFRFGGIIQRISEQRNIGRDEVVAPGASKYQDQRSHKGRQVQASHVVRAGKINPNIKNNSKDHNELKNFLGHTQNIPKYANEWHGVGGDIDRHQANSLDSLGMIDFREDLTNQNKIAIEAIKKDHINILGEAIGGGKLGCEEKKELIKAREFITNLSNESLFENGKQGYSGKYMDVYRDRSTNRRTRPSPSESKKL